MQSLSRATSRSPLLLVVFLATTAAAGIAHAGVLTLCDDAKARGFTLTTFASGFPNAGNVGPIGVAYRQDGGVLVADPQGGHIYLLPNHKDNQVWPFEDLIAHGQGDAQALAQIQNGSSWKYYMSQYIAGKIVEIDEKGVIVDTIVDLPIATALIPYPPTGAVGTYNGHLFATDSTATIWDVDPVAKTKTAFAVPGSVPDGLTFSPDGLTLYVALEAANVIRAYDVPSGAMTWQSAVVAGGADGIAIGLGALTGYIYVNYNNGTVMEFGLPNTGKDGEINCIATGGSRGDFIAADPNVYCPGGYPSLLLTQTDRIMRLDPPGSGFFGPPTSATEPVTPCSSQASWANYGSGWPGTNGIPSFTAEEDPALCTTVTLDLANSRGVTTTAALFVGLTQIDQPTIYGGHLLVSPRTIFLFPIPAAGAPIPGDLPCDGSLCGLPVNIQALEMDPGASKGVSFTPGLQLVLGG
ncbi:MAG: hypothetical protein U1E76_14530 [Planctomycetota bacterium]